MVAIYWGYLLDLIFGDPHALPHPVRWIGNLIMALEKPFHTLPLSPRGKRLAGTYITLVTVAAAFLVPFGILRLASYVSPWLRYCLETLMIFQILATSSLGNEAEKVYKHLKAKDLEKARYQISMLVSRDTGSMTEEDVSKATIETVSENFADGIVAPLFFVVIGGAPLGWAYKAVNTLDSMIGYKNEKYMDMGRTAALVDDAVNYIPARVSVVFIWLAALWMKLDFKQSISMVKRDHDKHSSPNSAWPESAFAGALQVQLGGKASYFGKVEMKPTMGEPIKPVDGKAIRKAIQLMYVASFIGLMMLTGVRGLLMHIL